MTGRVAAISRWWRRLWFGLGVLSMVVAAMPGHAAIDDCATDDGISADLVNRACAALRALTEGSAPSSEFHVDTTGNDSQADIAAAIADLGISVNLESLTKTETRGMAGPEFFDLAGAPLKPASRAPYPAEPSGWTPVPGQKIVDFRILKPRPIFKIYDYTPAASDGRYSRYSNVGLLGYGEDTVRTAR